MEKSALNEKLKIRFAKEEDTGILLDFIKRLAVYEKRPESVKATNDNIKKTIFEKKIAEAIIAGSEI